MTRLFGGRMALPKLERGDLAWGAVGGCLALGCALFPWYIFHNQEKFQEPRVTFSGVEVQPSSGVATATPALPRSGDVDVHLVNVPELELDDLPTGSLPDDSSARATPLEDQPMPEPVANFKVLHASAGRAMIEDDTGIWVVQPGSRLPDNSVVRSIARKNGQWVLVTDSGKVLAGSP